MTRLHFTIIIGFVIALIAPVQTSVFIGEMRISPYRFFLLISFVPSLFLFFTSRSVRPMSHDYLIFFYAVWAALSLFVNHPVGQVWQGVGIYTIEITGAYLLGRCLVQTRAALVLVVKTHLYIVFIFLFIAAWEAATGRHLQTIWFGTIAQHMSIDYSRAGMFRAYVTFEHPILFGVFCSSLFGLTIYHFLSIHSRLMSFSGAAIIFFATFFSLSSGPILAIQLQMMLLLWDFSTRRVPHRVAILLAWFIACYIAVDVLSNRSPFTVLTSYLALNPRTAVGRADIWHWGSINVLRNPLFGIGHNDWERAEGMTASMDAHWLLVAVTYGLPAALCLLAAIAVMVVRLGRLRLAPPVTYYRNGWIISLMGLAIAGSAVAFWNATLCWLMFLLGSGAWMLEVSPSKPQTNA